MNSLDRKIDSMIKDNDRYEELNLAIKQLSKVMTKSSIISFLKYAESVNKAVA